MRFKLKAFYFLIYRILISLLILIFVFNPAPSYTEDLAQVELIFDASRSMSNKINGILKITLAREAINKFADELASKGNFLVGLRIFGHKNIFCNNSELEIPIGKSNPGAIKSKCAGIIPLGNTPIAYSIKKAAEDFDMKNPGRRIIILITDGYENCKDNPCEVAKLIKAKDIDAKIHIVGIGLSASQFDSLKCIVKPSGGIVITADDPVKLTAGIHEIISLVTSAKVEKKPEKAHNLILTGTDQNNSRIFIHADVLKNNIKIASAEGDIAGFSLDKGKYSIVVKSAKTGQIIKIDDIEIHANSILKKVIRFGEAGLMISARGKNGKMIEVALEIFRSGSEVLIIKKERVEINVDELTLPPGTYDIKIIDLETGHVKSMTGMPLSHGVNIKEIYFERGEIVIQGKGSNGTVKFLAVETYRAASKQMLKKTTGEKIHRHILYPGIYDLKINDWYGKGEEWIKNIKINDGDSIRKDIIFNE